VAWSSVADSETYYESCVIPYDLFYSKFDSLADVTSPHKALFEELLGYVKEEKLMISPPRFELLLSCIQPAQPRGIRRAAFRLINEFAHFPPDKFLEMIPPTFVTAIAAILPSSNAFELLTHFATILPDVVSQYMDLGILAAIASNLDFHSRGFESALDLLAGLLRFPLVKADLLVVVEQVLRHIETCNRTRAKFRLYHSFGKFVHLILM
jgi:hypothetical protein